MDKWLERLVNLSVLVMVAAAAVTLYERYRTSPVEATYEVGDVVNAVRLGIAERSIVLVTRSTCPFCTASMPFYKRLVQAGVPIIAVAAEDTVLNRSYLADHGVEVRTVIALSDSALNIRSTPTLMIVREDGTVDGFWQGQLAEGTEIEVWETVQGRQGIGR